jgi:hypothetical protein
VLAQAVEVDGTGTAREEERDAIEALDAHGAAIL